MCDTVMPVQVGSSEELSRGTVCRHLTTSSRGRSKGSVVLFEKGDVFNSSSVALTSSSPGGPILMPLPGAPVSDYAWGGAQMFSPGAAPSSRGN